ncbi:hypothetical protein COW46_03395 [Candidatus Gracilibacteria bacterium CG17_big_fil_post_rev_8_21_14_2_50_48_13]|nr:MAG: hypothetical protein COW46_03395 [Candidatus Gracilibacteria bacterium CG17_big_fil_post_rev_8_21_14_2_50_48_13]
MTYHLLQDVLDKHGYSKWHCEKVQQGVSTEVYRFQRNNQVHFLRILPQGKKPSLECSLHEQLQQHGIPVPKVVFYHDPQDTAEQGYMMVKHIGGTALTGTSVESPKDEEKLVLREAGLFLAQLQEIPVEGYGPILTERDVIFAGSPTSPAEEQTQLRMEELLSGSFISIEEYEALQQCLIEADSLGPAPHVLAHGDLRLDHIFCDQGYCTGFIDFGGMRVAGELYDLAFFKVHYPLHVPFLLEGYAQRKPLPHHWSIRIMSEATSILVQKLYKYRHASTFPNFRHRLNLFLRTT